MSDKEIGNGEGLEIDINTLIRENAQAVADYELADSPQTGNQDRQDRQRKKGRPSLPREECCGHYPSVLCTFSRGNTFLALDPCPESRRRTKTP